MQRIFISCLFGMLNGDWVNKDVVRDVRIGQASLVETITTFSVVPGSLKDFRPYSVYVDDYSNVGDIVVSVDGTNLDQPVLSKLVHNRATFDIPLEKAATVVVRTIAGNELEPFPAAIRELEKQFVVVKLNLFVVSPHPVQSESMSISLPPGALLENFSHLDLVDTSNGRLTFLKKKIAARKKASSSNEVVSIHFAHPYPMPFIASVSRTVDVSHWGAALSIKEEIELVNGAARLAGEFNRVPFTHMKFAQGKSSPFAVESALVDIGAIVPFEAVNIHYRDVIGNISSSAARRVVDEAIQFTYVSLSPRFPLMGGWKTEFEFSYDLPASSGVLRSVPENDSFLVQIPLSHAIPSLLAREMKVTINLPPGASDIDVTFDRRTSVPVVVEESFGWLDNRLGSGRTRVSFSLGTTYIQPDNCLNEKVYIRYVLPKSAVYKAPMLLSLYLFVLIASILLVRRIQFRIFNPEESKVSEMLDFDYDICKEIEDSLTDLQTMNAELIELVMTSGKLDSLVKTEYISQHKNIHSRIEVQCAKFVSEKNKVDRTIRILMNLKAQKDAAVALMDDAIAGKKNLDASRLVNIERDVASLVSRVLTGQESPPPSPGGTPPSRSSKKHK